MKIKLIGLFVLFFIFTGSSFAVDRDDRGWDGGSDYRINNKLNIIIRKLNRLESKIRNLERQVARLRRSQAAKRRSGRDRFWQCVIWVDGQKFTGLSKNKVTARRAAIRKCRIKRRWSSCSTYQNECIPPDYRK